MGGACSTEEGRAAYRVLWGNLGTRPFGRPRRRLQIILKRIFKNIVGAWTLLIRLNIGSSWVAVMNHLVSVKSGEFLD